MTAPGGGSPAEPRPGRTPPLSRRSARPLSAVRRRAAPRRVARSEPDAKDATRDGTGRDQDSRGASRLPCRGPDHSLSHNLLEKEGVSIMKKSRAFVPAASPLEARVALSSGIAALDVQPPTTTANGTPVLTSKAFHAAIYGAHVSYFHFTHDGYNYGRLDNDLNRAVARIPLSSTDGLTTTLANDVQALTILPRRGPRHGPLDQRLQGAGHRRHQSRSSAARSPRAGSSSSGRTTSEADPIRAGPPIRDRAEGPSRSPGPFSWDVPPSRGAQLEFVGVDDCRAPWMRQEIGPRSGVAGLERRGGDLVRAGGAVRDALPRRGCSGSGAPGRPAASRGGRRRRRPSGGTCPRAAWTKSSSSRASGSRPSVWT